jgi:branched-chain amino acid transport system permease protein
LGFLLAATLILAGAGALVEMIYHLQLNSASGGELPFAGWMLNTNESSHWIWSSVVLLLGLVIFEAVRRHFNSAWEQVQTQLIKTSQVGTA